MLASLITLAKPGAKLEREAVDARLKDIVAYRRPGHVVFVGGGELPYNRVAKIDYRELKNRAQAEVERLRQAGGWDRA